MAERTPEQRHADDALHDAIAAVARLDNRSGDVELLVDWVAVYACTLASDAERTVYGTAYPHGSLPTHRIQGLLHVAARFIDEQGEGDDDG